jgi:hypothetical protein
MTEEHLEVAGAEDQDPTAPEPERDPESDPAADSVRTGVLEVDEVIVAVEQLEDRPIEEHVGVFEAAHDQLRRALDTAAHPSDDA